MQNKTNMTACGLQTRMSIRHHYQILPAVHACTDCARSHVGKFHASSQEFPATTVHDSCKVDVRCMHATGLQRCMDYGCGACPAHPRLQCGLFKSGGRVLENERAGHHVPESGLLCILKPCRIGFPVLVSEKP